MGSGVTQPKINTREKLNQFDTHNHDNRYVKHGEVFGKNILINADKSESQRGDYTTPVALDLSTYYIDRVLSNRGATGTFTIEQEVLDSEIKVRPITYTATANQTSHAIHTQIIEDYSAIAGKTVTFTAQVKTNASCTVNIGIYDDVSLHYKSSDITPDGEWHTISITKTLPETVTDVRTQVSFGYRTASEAHLNGDYVSVGNEQLELGDKFTGFEVVDPAVNLARCKRYYQNLTNSELSTTVIGTGQATNDFQCFFPIRFSDMRTAPTVTINNQTSFKTINATGVGISLTGLTADELTSSSLRLVGTVGTGLVAGDATFLRQNATNAEIQLDAEIY